MLRRTATAMPSFCHDGRFRGHHAQYADFQSRMEHYWCLRWLIQEKVQTATATVVRDNLVRFDAIPLYLRVADLPASVSDTRVRLGIGPIDLLAATIEVHHLGPATD
jgi:exoribonuclease-2